MTQDLKFTCNADTGSYDAFAGEELVGTLVFERTPDRLILSHIAVPSEHRNRGLASGLVQATLDDAKAKGLTVTPLCPFVVSYIRNHPAYESLVDKHHPGRYRLPV